MLCDHGKELCKHCASGRELCEHGKELCEGEKDVRTLKKRLYDHGSCGGCSTYVYMNLLDLVWNRQAAVQAAVQAAAVQAQAEEAEAEDEVQTHAHAQMHIQSFAQSTREALKVPLRRDP